MIHVNGKTREQVQQEQEIEKSEFKKNQMRHAFMEESDPLFFQYMRGEKTQEEWLAKVEEIKNRFI